MNSEEHVQSVLATVVAPAPLDNTGFSIDAWVRVRLRVVSVLFVVGEGDSRRKGFVDLC
jgi:hypothetical protein